MGIHDAKAGRTVCVRRVSIVTVGYFDWCGDRLNPNPLWDLF